MMHEFGPHQGNILQFRLSSVGQMRGTEREREGTVQKDAFAFVSF